MFKGVLTRDGDYFISVMGRSDVARKQNANFLVSIHADAAPNRSATGASVWVLSNRRANSEMASWLEQHEKQSELLGGAGDVLANSQSDPYLSQAVLDLQFGHSQRVGYDVATSMISQLQRIGEIHKRRQNTRVSAFCVRRISHQYWSKPVLSATTAKNVCWRATITNNSWQKPFTKACAIISLRIRCNLRRRGQRHKRPVR